MSGARAGNFGGSWRSGHGVTRKSGVRAGNFVGSRAKGRQIVGMDQREKSNGVEGVASDEAMGLEEAVRKAPVRVLGGRIAKKRQR